MGEGWRLGYRPELDGLRGVAVLLVMLTHAQLDAFPWGGITGVTMFFTLSGFLITALLIEERRQTGTVSLRAFWRRRAVRLLPALAVLVTVVMVLPLGDLQPSWGHVAGIAGYVANWVKIGTEGESFGVLNHLWSLSIEEQFYVVWPVVMVVAWRWLGRRVLWLVSALAVGSATLRWAVFDLDGFALHSYFGTDTNAFAMLAGCALAVALTTQRALHVARWMGWTAAGFLLLATGVLPTWFASTGWFSTFRAGSPSGFVFGIVWTPMIVATCTVVVIAWLVTSGEPAFRSPALVEVGRRSYGLYLWHYPVFLAASKWWVPLRGEVGVTAVLFVVSGAIAWASFRWIEQPARRRWRGQRERPAGGSRQAALAA